MDPAEEVGAAATVTRHTDSHSAKGVTLAQWPQTPTDAHLAGAPAGCASPRHRVNRQTPQSAVPAARRAGAAERGITGRNASSISPHRPAGCSTSRRVTRQDLL
jgi:hypothetical protein